MPQFQYQLRIILATIMWIVALTSALVLIYLSYYIKNPGFYKQKRPILETQIAREIDFLLVFVICFCGSILLEDLKAIFYGFIATMLTSIVLLTLCIFFNAWFVFGWYSFWSGPWEWEIIFAASLTNTFMIIFPGILAFSLLGLFTGAFLRDILI